MRAIQHGLTLHSFCTVALVKHTGAMKQVILCIRDQVNAQQLIPKSTVAMGVAEKRRVENTLVFGMGQDKVKSKHRAHHWLY